MTSSLAAPFKTESHSGATKSSALALGIHNRSAICRQR
jgi:hypothetical protein